MRRRRSYWSDSLLLGIAVILAFILLGDGNYNPAPAAALPRLVEPAALKARYGKCFNSPKCLAANYCAPSRFQPMAFLTIGTGF